MLTLRLRRIARRGTPLAVLGLLALGAAVPARAQCVSLTAPGAPYAQNFDTLVNTGTSALTLAGWALAESGANANATYTAGTGGSNSGDTYSFGAAASTDRALGGLRSGSLVPSFGACFTNNTGGEVTSLGILYTGEEWRLGTAGRTDRIDFSYSVDATSLTTGTWTDVNALDFTTPDTATTGAKNGNAAADRTALMSMIAGLTVPNGATVWIRWTDVDATGADDGLAVDDFSLAPNPLWLSVNDVTAVEGNSGTTTFTFTASLSSPAPAGGVTFDIATADGTATTADNDYVTQSLTGQTIAEGSTTYTFAVTVNGDATVEPDQTFFVDVTNVVGTGVTLVDGHGIGTITNDDVAPTLSINDVAALEGDSGATTFTFTVGLSVPAPVGGVTFDIATVDGTATTADNDYATKSLTGQTIAEGSTTYTFDVTVNGDTTVEPNQTFSVDVTNVVGTGVTALDGQGIGTITNDDFVVTPIHDIQGNGASSPLVGSVVTTRGVVTGVKNNGFFIQEPDATVDADPATSEGVFVFTNTAPPASAVVGNLTVVVATVAEYVPSADLLQPPFTELTLPSVTLLSSGNPLPAPVALSATFPDPAGSVGQLERLEGMRVSLASLTVSGPTLGNITEASGVATSTGVFHGVVTGVARPFREPGILADDPPPSGSIPPIPRFDGNPEIIRVDSDGQTGAAALEVGAGAVVTGLVGPFDYSFRAYTILPDPATPPTVAGGPTAAAVSSPTASEVTVGSFNLQRFFDDVNDPAIGEPVLSTTTFDNRLNKASLAIRNYLKTPDIIGVQEVENLTTLQTLATRISTDALAASQNDPLYQAYLVEGNDVGGIDVGFLVKTAVVSGTTPRVEVNAVIQERAGTLFVNADSSTELLNDRPPLRLDAVVHFAAASSFPLTVIVNHLRSLNGVNDTSAGSLGWATVGDRVRAKRLAQAEDLADLVQDRQTADPAERILLVGDLNAFDLNDGLVDSLGVIKGTPTPDNETAVPGDGVDLVNPDLASLVATVPSDRYSYVFDGNAQSLDHVLVNQPLMDGTSALRVEHPRIGADFPETARNNASTPVRLSDHDPAVAYFTLPALTADLSITKTDGQSTAVPGQTVTYTITAANAGPAAVVAATVTDTVPVGITGVTWTCVGAGGGTCTSSGSGDISQTVDLPVGASVTFTLSGTVDPAVSGTLGNTAIIAPPTGVIDSDTTNNLATDTDTLTPQADLSITKTDGQTSVVPGQTVTYTIVASNAGPSAAAGSTIADSVPATLTGVTWTCLGSGGGLCSASGSGSIGEIVTLPVAATVTFTLTGTLDPVATGSLSNTATVVAPSGVTDPDAADNSATDTDSVDVVLGYYAVNPCRVVDTRGGAPVAGPALTGGETRVLAMASHCGIPATATAVSINVTVTAPTAPGHVRLFTAGEPLPAVSTLNYALGQTRANNAVVAVNAQGEIAAFAAQAAGTSVHIIIDVNGYFN